MRIDKTRGKFREPLSVARRRRFAKAVNAKSERKEMTIRKMVRGSRSWPAKGVAPLSGMARFVTL
jgi:hypothetical protein